MVFLANANKPDLAALSWCGAVCLQPADPSGWKVTPSDHRHKHSRDKATSPQLIRFCLFVTLFYFDNVHCDPPCNMVYIKRKTSFFAGGKKQKPFFSDGSFYLVFSSRTPADCRICKKEGPSIQRPAAWYQKPFFKRRFFFKSSLL